MILLAIEDVTQRKRSDLARLATAQEEERRRIARELHDDLIQRLAGLGMDLGAYAADTTLSSPRLKKGLRRLQGRVVEAAEVGRRVAYELHPFQLEDLGLTAALRAHCESLGTGEGLAVDFTSRNLPDGLKPEITACLYRVAQESLRNIAKHAKVKRATVSLEGTANSVRLTVEDRGTGFRVQATHAGHGLGLVGMRDRVQLANGKFSIASEPGKGTRVSVEVPL
jgi:signal transduction histidine kinase